MADPTPPGIQNQGRRPTITLRGEYGRSSVRDANAAVHALETQIADIDLSMQDQAEAIADHNKALAALNEKQTQARQDRAQIVAALAILKRDEVTRETTIRGSIPDRT
jgi:chromosome segregation ATPase